MKLTLLLFFFLYHQYTLQAQNYKEAIDFVNGKSNSGVHSIFYSPDEAQEYTKLNYGGLILHEIKLLKDGKTKEEYKPVRVLEQLSYLKYMNPFNIKVINDSKDIFYLELNTTNSAFKVRVNNYGSLIVSNSIRLGPYRHSDEENIQARLIKALAVAITHFGGKPDSF